MEDMDKRDVNTVLVFVCTFFFVRLATRRKTGVPPGPIPLPIIGNLYCLSSSDITGRIATLRRQYGDIFALYIGRELVVFLNGYDIIHDALVKRGSLFVNRPVSRLNELTFIHVGFILQNGHQWKEQRTFTQKALQQLCFRRGGSYIEQLITEEVQHAVDHINQLSEQGSFDVGKVFHTATANVVSTVLYGERFDFQDKQVRNFLDLVDKTSEEYLHKEVLVNCLPFLTRLPFDFLNLMATRKVFHDLLDWADTFIQKIKRQHDNGIQDSETFTGLFLRKMAEADKSNKMHTFDLENLKGSAIDLLSAGSGTVAETLRTLLVHMIRNPDVQERMFEEISTVIGSQSPTQNDRRRLPYTNAVMLEGLRITPVAPFGLPRTVQSDMVFHGYLIPKNCTVLPNFESLMSDKDIWKEPKEFRPERFLNKEQTKLVVPKEFLPFSAGPRSCVGESLARIELFTFLTSLVQNFKFLPAKDGEIPKVNVKFAIFLESEPYEMRVVKR